MATKPYYEVVYGTAKRVNYNGTVETYPRQVRLIRNLAEFTSSIGDYHSTTNHSYFKESYSSYTGIRETFLADGKRYESLSGPAIAGGLNITSYYSTNFSNHCYDSAVSNLLEKVRSSDLNLSEDLVQWKSVVKMVNIRDRAVSLVSQHVAKLLPISNRMVRLERELARGKKFRTQRRIDEWNYLSRRASGLHLEFIYGWMPLASTVHELAERAVSPKAPGHFRIEGKYARSNRIQLRRPNTTEGSSLPEAVSGVESEFCRIVCYMSPVQDVLESLNATSSLNPALVAYTAFPYSFVFDWFVNLGGWMQNYETYLTHKNNFVDGYVLRGRRIAVSKSWVGEYPLSWPTGAKQRVDLKADQMYVRFRRQRLTSLPVQIRPTVNIDVLNPSRCLAAASMIVQLRPIEKLISFTKK